MRKPASNIKGKVRSFRLLLGLSILTLGIYFIYWLHINLKEITDVASFDISENTTETTKRIFVLYIISIVATVITLYYSVPKPIKIFSLLFIVLVICGIVRALFFYYFTAVVRLGQEKAKLTFSSLTVSKTYYYYILGLTLAFIGGFLSLYTISIVGVALIWVYVYKIQNQINRIWLEGKFDDIRWQAQVSS